MEGDKGTFNILSRATKLATVNSKEVLLGADEGSEKGFRTCYLSWKEYIGRDWKEKSNARSVAERFEQDR